MMIPDHQTHDLPQSIEHSLLLHLVEAFNQRFGLLRPEELISHGLDDPSSLVRRGWIQPHGHAYLPAGAALAQLKNQSITTKPHDL